MARPNEGSRDRRPREGEDRDSEIVEKLVHINRVAATVTVNRVPIPAAGVFGAARHAAEPGVFAAEL